MPSMVATTVVTKMMFQKTPPMALQSPHAKYIWMPNMAKMKNSMNPLNPLLLMKSGIFLFRLILVISLS